MERFDAVKPSRVMHWLAAVVAATERACPYCRDIVDWRVWGNRYKTHANGRLALHGVPRISCRCRSFSAHENEDGLTCVWVPMLTEKAITR